MHAFMHDSLESRRLDTSRDLFVIESQIIYVKLLQIYSSISQSDHRLLLIVVNNQLADLTLNLVNLFTVVAGLVAAVPAISFSVY